MWFLANVISLMYLLTPYSQNAQVPKIVFFTGGNSLMPEDIYSSFMIPLVIIKTRLHFFQIYTNIQWKVQFYLLVILRDVQHF